MTESKEQQKKELGEDEIIMDDVFFWLYPEELSKGVKKEYKVIGVKLEDTQWGKRALFTLEHEGQGYKITSWNLAMREKKVIKPVELIGKNITLEGLSEKKLLCYLP